MSLEKLDKFAKDLCPQVRVSHSSATSNEDFEDLHTWVFPNDTRVVVSHYSDGGGFEEKYTLNLNTPHHVVINTGKRVGRTHAPYAAHTIYLSGILKHRTIREAIKDYISKAAKLDKTFNK